MSNLQRAAVVGVGSALAATAAGLVVFWPLTATVVPLVLCAVGTSVAYAPGYDESRPFGRKQRERFGIACLSLALMAWVAVGYWWAATHPGD